MRRSYKFLLRPTSKQVAALEACLEDTRLLYNAALEERREAWRRGVSVNFHSQDGQLKEIRAADPERYGRWSFNCERSAVRRLDRAFQGFFRRVKAGEKPGYPRFKGRGWWDSVEWPSGDGAKWDSVPHPTVTRLYLKGIGHVRVHQHRAVKGRVKTVTVKREGSRWYVILSCDDVPAERLPATGAVVGIDMGVASFLTDSGGGHVPNPRHLAASSGKLARGQRALARKKRGSKRRKRAAAKVAGLGRKVGRQRLDHAHKTALALVRDYDLIAHEELQVANMTRRPKPRLAEDGSFEPNGAAAKSGLNRSIRDAGWGIFLRILHAKAESAGREVIAVNPRHTSQRCAECGHVAAGNRVSQAEFRCQACGHTAHADVNAAVNILRAGLALQAKLPEKSRGGWPPRVESHDLPVVPGVQPPEGTSPPGTVSDGQAGQEGKDQQDDQGHALTVRLFRARRQQATLCLVNPDQETLSSDVPDTQDIPLDEDLAMDDADYARIMRRIGIAEGEPGTSVSAFNSSI